MTLLAALVVGIGAIRSAWWTETFWGSLVALLVIAAIVTAMIELRYRMGVSRDARAHNRAMRSIDPQFSRGKGGRW